MNLKKALKPFLPVILTILGFIIASSVYFSPVLEGKSMSQMDYMHARAMSHELEQYKDATGETAHWTNSMFSGMPAYQIKGDSSTNIYSYINRIVRLNLPYTTIAVLFVLFLGFYILLSTLKLNHWVRILGSIAYAFVTYNFFVLNAGHITKVYAIAFMPPVIAGVLMTYRKQYLVGGVLTAVALGVEIAYNHVQITYYLAITIAILGVSKLIFAILEKEIKHFAVASGILLGSVVLAVLPNLTQLWSTYEYGKYSTRGESELTIGQAERADTGLDKDYVFGWSYGVAETWSFLIPNIKGGGGGAIGNVPEAMEKVTPQYKQFVAQQNRYWGNQPWTDGPVYVGAITLLLFLIGMFILDWKTKGWLLGAVIMSFLLGWGKNIPGVADFLYYHLPLYNKFRSVSMGMCISTFAIPLGAVLTLQKLIEMKKIGSDEKKTIYVAAGVLVGLTIIFLAMPTNFFDFFSAREAQVFAQEKAKNVESAAQIDQALSQIKTARVAIMRSDALRSLAYLAVGALLLVAFAFQKIKKQHLLVGLVVLLLIDMWSIDRRYLNNDAFRTKKKVENQFVASKADQFILKDTDIHYRVHNITRDPFNDGITPYFHKAIGGYHGAKLRRYQDLIEYQLSQNNQEVFNMLNTKYFIVPNKTTNQPTPEIIMSALGNAWFVEDYKIVENADEEIMALNDFDPSQTAIIDKRFADYIEKLPDAKNDSTSKGLIKLISYAPDELKYQTNMQGEKLAVFSEIYYPAGWNAYVDGKLVEHIRVNYVLRALIVPKGSHLVEFKFEPSSYFAAQKISGATSILVGILLILVVAMNLKTYIAELKQVEVKEPKTVKAKVQKKRQK